ncbi:MAG: hypothetical protein ABS99_10470 [Acetobacteraceae bacterium SCN 69-10]|nr:hypothetical protein [Rhodospirillales bacterium]ODU53843.1 MAG: hypothetical protein ABS99_10470 [Acetobacteraceae bacterium SCN 69-10]OJY70299.1 MAG: hypothetical protein BGP12_21350 [Rhodospirillales bacterium 70-18]
MRLPLLIAAMLAMPAALAAQPAPLPPGRISVPGPQGGSGLAPVYLSADWTAPQPGVTRAVIVMHGLARNADTYFAAGLAARQAAGPAGAATLVIAPRILGAQDVVELHAPADMLRWRHGNWAGGAAATAPVPASSFAVFDAIIARLADRALFPALREIVVAGHSAGGQVVQRYAAVAPDNPALAREGIGLRYVVANPSTYVYFTPARPWPTAACPGYNAWKYGFASRLPAYVQGDPASLERRYRGRDVTYLLGTLDTDPNHPALDKSCAAEAEGPSRYTRGHAYFAALQADAGGPLAQRLFDVPGVGHNGHRMFTSPCGLAALFETPGCPKDK